MALKEEVIKIGEQEVKVHQLSFAGQMRLDSLGDKRTMLDIYKECMEDSTLLEKLNAEEGLEIVRAINRVNNWLKEKEVENVKDFQ